MVGTDSLSVAFGNIFWAIGEVAFTWVPATMLAVTGTGQGTPPPLVFNPQPVLPQDFAAYITQNQTPEQLANLYRGWGELVALSVVVSLLMGALIIYCAMRILEVRRHEWARFSAAAHTVAAQDLPKTQLRWNRILEEVNTPDEQRWRLAILEADIMLNELLDLMGYRGETMADKMKHVERGDFNTIDLAWEAHRVRNAIAHQGSLHLLSQREAQRVIGLYEQIFREHKIIA